MADCSKCHTDDCAVLARLEGFRRDPFAFIPLSNAMIACGIAASYRRPRWAGEQPVTKRMIDEIWDRHEACSTAPR